MWASLQKYTFPKPFPWACYSYMLTGKLKYISRIYYSFKIIVNVSIFMTVFDMIVKKQILKVKRSKVLLVCRYDQRILENLRFCANELKAFSKTKGRNLRGFHTLNKIRNNYFLCNYLISYIIYFLFTEDMGISSAAK